MIMNNMQICISEKLYLEYPMVHVSLCNALERSNVKYQILPNTKEVWAVTICLYILAKEGT